MVIGPSVIRFTHCLVKLISDYRLKNIWCSFLQHTVVDHSCWYKQIFQGLSIPWCQHNFPASSSTNHKMSVSIWLLNWHAKKAYEREKVALVIHLLADEKKNLFDNCIWWWQNELKKTKKYHQLGTSIKVSKPVCQCVPIFDTMNTECVTWEWSGY